MIVMPAASDWSDCKNSAGRTAAIERLNRLRELYYAEPESLGERKLDVTRLSANAKFRSYAENAHWVVGDVLYATVNVPANNNHYLPEAGRNSEYEDRLVANRFWLNRLFALARAQEARRGGAVLGRRHQAAGAGDGLARFARPQPPAAGWLRRAAPAGGAAGAEIPGQGAAGRYSAALAKQGRAGHRVARQRGAREPRARERAGASVHAGRGDAALHALAKPERQSTPPAKH